jgi:hypothetical protein
MKMKRVIPAMLMLLMMHTALPAESFLKMELDNHQNDNADKGNGTQEAQISKKYEDDLVMAYFMAIVPGFFVHGAGNMYAGKWPRGLILFNAGLLGTIGILRCTFTVSGENYWEEDANSDTWLLLGSLVLFFGSYAWDIFTVGSAIGDRHPESARFSMGMLPGKSLDNKEQMLFGIRISF